MMVAMATTVAATIGGDATIPTNQIIPEFGFVNDVAVPDISPVTAPIINVRRLRPIIIDGSNVAMNHGNKRTYSCRGIRLCADWFMARGHEDITVFVPQWRTEESKEDTPIHDRQILYELEAQDRLVFTPSRKVTIHVDANETNECHRGAVREHRVVCYDDRYIVKVASETGGVIVSNDNYRDLARESSAYASVIRDRLLMYTFVKDRFMPPDDPLGRNGPSIDEFLMMDPPSSATLKKDLALPICPYGPKCTYGNKCKFAHPERKTKTRKITEELAAQAQKEFEKFLNKDRSISLTGGKKALCRTFSLQHQPNTSLQHLDPRMDKTQAHNQVTCKAANHHQRGGSLRNNETRRKPCHKLKHESSLPLLDTFIPTLSLPSLQSNLAAISLIDSAGLVSVAHKKTLGKTISDPYGQLRFPKSLPIYQNGLTLDQSLPFSHPYFTPVMTASNYRHVSPPHFNLEMSPLLTYPTNPLPSHCPTIPETWVYGPCQAMSLASPLTNSTPSYFSGLLPRADLPAQPLRPPYEFQLEPPTTLPGFALGDKCLPSSSFKPNSSLTGKAVSFGHTSELATGNAVNKVIKGKRALEKKLSAPPFLNSNRGRNIRDMMSEERSLLWSFIPHTSSSDLVREDCTTAYSNIPPCPLSIKVTDSENVSMVSLPPNILSFLCEYESKTSTAGQNNSTNFTNSMDPAFNSTPSPWGSDAHQFDVGHQNKRLTLYFHLASLFPEDHVKIIMNRYPDITDPRKLCSILLKM